jgi:hypothetical protein
VRSSALLFARQTSPASTRVVAFGWDRVRFKSPDEKRQMRDAFRLTGVSCMAPTESPSAAPPRASSTTRPYLVFMRIGANARCIPNGCSASRTATGICS